MGDDRDDRRADPFARAAFAVSFLGLLISLVGAAIAFVHFVDYSEVELLPIEQVVVVLDDRRAGRHQTIVAPEISIFNRASGAYSDAIRNVTFEITTEDGGRFCFEDMAYSRLRIDGVAIGARLNRTSAPPMLSTDETTAPGDPEPCTEVECIRQGVEGEFLLVTLDDAIPQTLPAGSVYSGRIAFKPRPCTPEAPIPDYQAMLDAMLDQTVTFEVRLDTLKDGEHSTRCTLEFTERGHTFATREKFLAQSCTPAAADPPTSVDRFRAWLDRQT